MLKNSLAAKKCSLMQNVIWEKIWNPMWKPRNGCDGSLMAKKLITIIKVNFVLIHSESGMRQHRFTWIVAISFLPFNYHHSHFLTATLDFITFSHGTFCMRPHLFLQPGYFEYNHSIMHSRKNLKVWFAVSKHCNRIVIAEWDIEACASMLLAFNILFYINFVHL